MQRALELALLGRGHVSPNPLVGCVLVKDGVIIGEGFHARYGTAHAEAAAIADCKARGNSAAGATAYVTLEPCAHFGKTPPCADLLVSEGIARCVIAVQDPYREVDGRGIEKLCAAGIEVEVGLCEAEAREGNRFFLKHSVTGLPYITLKAAMSLDGKVALKSGKSKYITSEASRREVHRLRSYYDAVMVASATVLADDPELTVRLVEGRQPRRIILDSSLRVDTNANVYGDAHAAATIIIANRRAAEDKAHKVSTLEERGVTLVTIEAANEQLDLEIVLRELGTMGINSILVEPGPTLATTLLKTAIPDELVFFLAPTVLGDDARSFMGDLHLRSLAESPRYRLLETHPIENSSDVLLRYGRLASALSTAE